ncbi:MAG: PEGA domain-containing protein [Syntrophothermus sp.]|uniref:CARDB domain-containing protein n=1 Tax=Syntrophothermus sp. TaxID=2736299 RepID=UPI00257D01B5|nr:CARDB domain-containing protein [Syntrophothermus sp.]NSW82608.1 PEGA domain-containing protein [Syntrophothermus sp.]
MLLKLLKRRGSAAFLSFVTLVSLLLFPFTGSAGGVSPDGSFSVVSPREGETLLAGQSCTVAWTYTGDVGRYLRIQLYKGGSLKTTISSYTSAGSDGSGSYSWKVSSSLAQGDDYQIKITSVSKSTISAMSGAFSVRPQSQSASPPTKTSATPLDVSKLLPSVQERQDLSRASDEEEPIPSSAAQTGPDLTITEIKMQPNPANLGANVTFSVTVKNSCNSACPAGGTVKVVSAGVVKTKNLPSLNAQASSTVTVAGVTLPQTSKEEITVQVEPPSGTVDINPTNNSRQYSPNTLEPDLAVTKILTDPSVSAPGSPVKVTVTVKNLGPGSCPAGAVVKLTGSPGTPEVTQTSPAPMAKGSERQFTFTNFPMPSKATDSLTAEVLPPPDVKEVSASNNALSLAPSLPSFDLTITAVKMTPDPASLGTSVTLSVTVKNAGSTPCPANGQVKVTSGGTVRLKNMSYLAAQASATFSVGAVPLPTAGSPVMTIQVEPPAGTGDINPDNNSQQYTPNIIKPDLTVTGISTSPFKAAPGAPVKVTVTVKNLGPGTCPAGATVKLTGSPGALSLQTVSTPMTKNSQKQVVFNGFPMPSNTTDKLVAQISTPSGVGEVSTANNSASLQPNLLLPTVEFISLTSSGYWSAGGGKPALGDPIFFKATLKNTSNYQITNLPVQLSYQGQTITTTYVNINPKSSVTTEFNVVVRPGALPPGQNTVTYTVTVNPPGSGSLLISPATLSKTITLEVLKTGTVYALIRQPDDSIFDQGGFTVTCSAGSYSQEINTGEASIAVFRDVPIGVNLLVKASKPGYMGYNGQDIFSGMLISSSMNVKLYLTNMGSAAVGAKSQATGNFLSGVTVEVVGTGQQDMTTQAGPASFSLPAGTYTFRLSKRGFAPTTVTGTVRAGQVTDVTGTLSYTTMTTVSGRIVDQNGNPLGGQKVDVIKWINNSVVASTTTDNSGSYTVTFDNHNVDPMYLKAVKGNASGRSEPECFYPGLRYRVDLVVSPPPPPPPASGWHEIKKKGCARAIAASVPDTFFTQGWDVSTTLGIFGIRLKYRNEYSQIAELKVELASGPAAIYNVSTEYNPGTVLGETASATAQSLIPTMSDTSADLLSFLIEESAPGITLSAEGGVGRTIVCLDRIEIIDRDSGQVVWASNSGLSTLDSGYSWTNRSYATGGVEWANAIIRAYIYLDGTDMLGPQNDRCKMISWDPGKKIVRYFNAPRNHPRFNVGD